MKWWRNNGVFVILGIANTCFILPRRIGCVSMALALLLMITIPCGVMVVNKSRALWLCRQSLCVVGIVFYIYLALR